jgi:hypothetical protein
MTTEAMTMEAHDQVVSELEATQLSCPRPRQIGDGDGDGDRGVRALA